MPTSRSRTRAPTGGPGRQRRRRCRGAAGRYAKAPLGDFDGNPARVTEMDAVVAYLQMLGTLVDFTTFKPEYGRR